MLATYRADLHVHTCLSPCGDLDMSPRGVVEAALAAGLDLIAVTDHNSAENVAATVRAAAGRGGPTVLCGLEVATSEEVHLLTLFSDPKPALAMQDLVYANFPAKTNRPEIFGDQVVANEFDEVEGFNDRLLIGAGYLDLSAAVRACHSLGGLAVAAHVDRPSFSLLGQLGFVPPDLALDAFEVSPRGDEAELARRFPDLAGRPLIRGSDAHFLQDIGSAWTEFRLNHPDLDEIRLALRARDGRRVLEKS
ncbi:MAG: PHP domain-containing protein [Proteobacteria bacterium]|nr:PHP domain-containing protein [Pseudomonadota bacterium]